MKKCILSIGLFSMAILLLTACSNKRSSKPTILVFSKTAAFHHDAIPTGVKALQDLGAKNGFDVDTTTNSNFFQEDSLKKYAAIVFLQTTGDILSGNEEIALERYVQSGGGFVGIHAASDTEYDWRWYGNMIGAYFESHPDQQEAKLVVSDATHASTKALPKEWVRKELLQKLGQANMVLQQQQLQLY